MALMSQQYIEQNDVVLRYLHGKLTAEELVEFEKYMLLHPDILQDIELTQVFKRGLELSAINAAASPKVAKPNRWAWPASGLATGAFATWLLLAPVSMQPKLSSVIMSPDIVYIDIVRGAIDEAGSQAEALIEQHSNGQVLIFDVSHFELKEYTLTLADQSGATIQQWLNIKPNEKNELILQTSIQGLKPDQYFLILSDKSQDSVLIKTRLIVE